MNKKYQRLLLQLKPMNTNSALEANQGVKILKLPQPQISSLPAKSVQSRSRNLAVFQPSRLPASRRGLANLSRTPLKLILPHHTLHRTNRAIHIFRIFFLIVIIRDITFHFKINQLPDRHPRIYTHRLCTRNF